MDVVGERGEPGSVWALAYMEIDAGKLKGSGQGVETSLQKDLPAWLDRLPRSSQASQ